MDTELKMLQKAEQAIRLAKLCADRILNDASTLQEARVVALDHLEEIVRWGKEVQAIYQIRHDREWARVESEKQAEAFIAGLSMVKPLDGKA